MPSLVTDNFRVFAAEQFMESLEEPYNSSNTPESDSSAAAQAYRSKIYLFTGRSQPWTEERYDGVAGVGEFDPPEAFDSFNDLNEVYDDMISMKRVNRADLSQVIRRNSWKSGVKYDMYRDNYTSENPSLNGQTHLYDAQFYVINSQYQVYKCIFNGETPENADAVVSTQEPTGTSTGLIGPLSDGYIWKYMYTISISDYIRFVSSDFMPVKTDSAVVSAAVDGAINQVVIKNRGTGLTAGDYWSPILGDGSSGIVKIVVASSGSFANKISTVTIAESGSGYTRGTVNLSEVYNSLSNAQGRDPSDKVGSGLSGSIEVIISPPGGHGANPSLELGGYRVMINKSLEFLDGDGDIPVDSQFRRFGLIADPQTPANADLTAASATACFAMKFPASGAGTPTGDFEVGKLISQNQGNDSNGQAIIATGRVIHYDSATKVLRYYQNEYLDDDGTGLNQYKLIPFTGQFDVTSTITQGNASISGRPDAAADSSSFGISFTDGYASPEVKKNSGNIIYVENRKAVNRSNDQTEDIKLVVEF